MMDLFPPLTAFCNRISEDPKIGTTHISMYMALLQQWNLNACENPIMIERERLMKAAKIHSRHTYNQCLNNLFEYGYIHYLPAKNRFGRSKVFLTLFENPS